MRVSFLGTKINVAYYNDLHGQVKNLDGFIGARNEFFRNSGGGGNFTLSGGDVFLDTSKNNEKVAKKLITTTDASAPGNHDIEGGESYFERIINQFNLKGKFVGTNISFKNENLNKAIPKSQIIERGGEKIGVVAAAPFDFRKLAFISPENKDIEIEDYNSTLKSVQKEVKTLEKNGVNKIFLLAHTGYGGKEKEEYYKGFAKMGGIDVIIGGHDHIEVDEFETSKRNEPVKIVSTGKSENHDFGENLDYWGALNLEFDDKGVLIKEKCKNEFRKTPESNGVFEGKTVYTLDEPLAKVNPLKGNSEIGNLIADSNLWYVNKHTKGEKADFALVNPGTIRDNFDSKEVTEEKIISTLPFTVSKLIKTDLSKKQIIETLEHGAKSTTFSKVSPGVMQVSGLQYEINPDMTVKNVKILNEDGSTKVNLDNCNDEDKFTCVYDIFLMTGVAGLSALKKDENYPNIEYFNVSRQDVMLDYLSSGEDIKNYKETRIKLL